MRIRSILASVLVTAGFAGLIACAGASKQRAGQAPESADAAAQPYDPRVQDISMLMTEVRRWRVDAGLPPDPLDSTLVMFTRPGPTPAPMCTGDDRPQDGHCGNVCDLSRHICENAEDICRIANDLAGNAWAAEKCSKANASCKEAEEACCGCDESKIPHGGSDDDSDPEANNRFWN